MRRELIDTGLAEEEQFAPFGPMLWARKTDLSEVEKVQAGEISATTMARFKLRYSSFSASILPTDQIVAAGRTYKITGISETGGRRRAFEISAVARADRV